MRNGFDGCLFNFLSFGWNERLSDSDHSLVSKIILKVKNLVFFLIVVAKGLIWIYTDLCKLWFIHCDCKCMNINDLKIEFWRWLNFKSQDKRKLVLRL